MRLEEKISAFAATPFCKGLEQSIIQKIAEAAEARHFTQGQTLVKAGDDVDGLYLVIEGQARVLNSFAGESKIVGCLKPNEVMGEVALIGGQKRSSTVIADNAMITLLLPVQDFRTLVAKHPEIQQHLEQLGQRRTTTNLELHLGELPEIED